MTICEKITNLRKRNEYSQIYVADKLKVTRQTYMKMESGKAPITTKHLQTIANIYGIPVEELFFESSDNEKFKQIYMYILSHFPKIGITKTKLAKLLYLVDFRHFYEKLESMSGVLYKHQQYGPLADPFLELTEEFIENGDIKIDVLSEGAQMIKFTSSQYKEGYPLLTKTDKKEIDEICNLWKDIDTKEIVNYTHNQKPWMASRDNEIIPYTLILQEDPENVYKPSSFKQ